MHKKIVLPFKVGCDPEFNVFGPKGEHLDVASLIYDDDDYDGDENLGTDAGEIAEIRPKPSNVLDTLVSNIRKILKKAYGIFGVFTWTTLSKGQSVGGHIHLEIPDKHPLLKSDKNINRYICNFASLYLPVARSENHENFVKRINGCYGKFSDFRFEKKGNHHTVEVRTPTAEWLTTPKTAYAVMAYCAVIHNELLFHPENVNRFQFLTKTTQQLHLLEELAKNPQPNEINALVMRRIKTAVKTFELYKPFAKTINWLWRANNVLLEKEKVDYEITKGWDLQPALDIKRMSNEKTIANRLANEKRTRLLDYIKKHQVKFCKANKDYNVDFFAQKLQDQTAAFGWKPKFNYVLFGYAHPEILAADGKLNILNLPCTAQNIPDNVASAFAKMHNRYHAEQSEKPTIYIGLPRTVRKEKNLSALTSLIHYLEFDRNTKTKTLNLLQMLPSTIKCEKQRLKKETCKCGICEPTYKHEEELIFKTFSKNGKEPN